MAASVKCKWILKRMAKFLNDGEICAIDKNDQETQELEISCKGRWKSYSGENKDLILTYLESDHLLLTKQDIILESFSLPCSKVCLKGVAKDDNLLMSYQLQDGNTRRFRIQFCAQDSKDAMENRKQCTDLLKKYITIFDHHEKDAMKSELTNVNEFILDKMTCRKGYSATVPKENLKEIMTLCLTDNTFPAFVTEINQLLKDIGKV